MRGSTGCSLRLKAGNCLPSEQRGLPDGVPSATPPVGKGPRQSGVDAQALDHDMSVLLQPAPLVLKPARLGGTGALCLRSWSMSIAFKPIASKSIGFKVFIAAALALALFPLQPVGADDDPRKRTDIDK